jgi:serine/threonine-protein kinase
MLQSQRLNELAESVADGATTDWESAESSATDHSDRETVVRLRAVASIGRFFATLSSRATAAAGKANPILAAGAAWGALRVIEHVGCGRFGDVYRAWDAALDREVALKILRANGEEVETDVVNEGRLMARVRHPNVVTIHGAQRIDGTTGLWMEFVKGRTLAAELAERGPFGPGELAHVGMQLCRALAAVHGAGLVHRDVKAQNVLRDETGRVVLGDFGTGREFENSSPSSGALAGTPTHLAPELFAGGPVTPQSDLYSLGVLLFHLATRAYPVAGRSLRDLRDAHTDGRRTALRALRPDLPKRLIRTIEKALDADPTRRFESAQSMAQALEACVSGTSPTRRSRAQLVGVASALVLAAAASAFTWHVGRRARPAIPFAERDWVLLTAFDNRTGDQSLDGALEYALERELSNSSFVNVVPRGRVEDTLQLMRKPRDTRVDMAIGREVALRDGKIRALVAGRIDKIGGLYSMSARILRPADGATAASVSDASIAQADLLRAVGRIAAAIRGQLGEALPPVEPKGAELQKVATQSMRALQLYSQARAMTTDGFFPSDLRTPRAIEQLLRDALREDPDFLWANILLAHAVYVQGGGSSEVIPHVERAVAAAVPGVDRYIAEAEVHSFRGEFSDDPVERVRYFTQSVAKLDAALQLQPDHFWALSGTMNITRNKLRTTPDAALIRRFVELRPNSVPTLAIASRDALGAGHLADAREYARRGRAIMDAPGADQNPPFAELLRFFPARDAWRQKDARQALLEADVLLADPRFASNAIRGGHALFSFYLGLGRLDRAEEFASRTENNYADQLRLIIAGERGDREAVRRLAGELLVKDGQRLSGRLSILVVDIVSALIDAGKSDVVRQVFAPKAPLRDRRHLPELVDALLAASDGRTARDTQLLERFVEQREPRAYDLGMRASLKLAEIMFATGDHVRAITTLERTALRPRNQDLFDSSVNRAQDLLARLYRQVGRTSKAEAIESGLRQLLAMAPDDHPIKRRLARIPARQAPFSN